MTYGDQGEWWFTDFAKLGVTASHNANQDQGEDSTLYGGDLTLRKSTES